MIDLEKEREKLESRGKFEHELLNRRVTWLLTSQTILFAAYGLALGEKVDETLAPVFKTVVPFIGFSISIAISIGIIAAFLAKWTAWREYNKKAVEAGDPEEKEIELGVKTWITIVGYIPDISFPIIFIYAWFKLAIIS